MVLVANLFAIKKNKYKLKCNFNYLKLTSMIFSISFNITCYCVFCLVLLLQHTFFFIVFIYFTMYFRRKLSLKKKQTRTITYKLLIFWVMNGHTLRKKNVEENI